MTRRATWADRVQVGDWIRTGFSWSHTDAYGKPVPFRRVAEIRPTGRILNMLLEDSEGNQVIQSFDLVCPIEVGAYADETVTA